MDFIYNKYEKITQSFKVVLNFIFLYINYNFQ